jgi:hypothetical protein
VIASPPDWALAWPVAPVLLAIRGIGSARLARALARAGTEADTPLGSLDDQQRAALVAWLSAAVR